MNAVWAKINEVESTYCRPNEWATFIKGKTKNSCCMDISNLIKMALIKSSTNRMQYELKSTK